MPARRGGSSIAGLSFEFARPASTYPAEYQGALFFADYSRNCIWVMQKNGNPIPSPGSIETVRGGRGEPRQPRVRPGRRPLLRRLRRRDDPQDRPLERASSHLHLRSVPGRLLLEHDSLGIARREPLRGGADQLRLGHRQPRSLGADRRLLGSLDGVVRLRRGQHDLHRHRRRRHPRVRGRITRHRQVDRPVRHHVHGDQDADRWSPPGEDRVLRKRRGRRREGELDGFGARRATPANTAPTTSRT